MKKIYLFSLIAICFLIGSCNQNSKSIKSNTTKLNIDGLKASPANFKLLLENKYVRVLEYTLKPGEKDTPHTHHAKSSYIVSGGKIKVYLENGETLIFDEKRELPIGVIMWANTPLKILEIQLW